MNDKTFTFELRSQFKELKVIFPLINTMLLNGSTCTVKVKSPNKTEFWESNNSYFLEICIFRNNTTTSSLTIRRNLATLTAESWEINSIFAKCVADAHITFDIDNTYKKVTVSINDKECKDNSFITADISSLIKQWLDYVPSMPNAQTSDDFSLLYNLDFFLRKDFPELVYLFPVFNLMIYDRASHFIQLKNVDFTGEDSGFFDFKLKLFYESQNRPSISVTAKLKNTSSKQQVSIYNFFSLAYSKPMLFNLNYLERHISLQAYCHKDSLSKANEVLETVFFPIEQE